jgi:hypothetical protein
MTLKPTASQSFLETQDTRCKPLRLLGAEVEAGSSAIHVRPFQLSMSECSHPLDAG